MKNMDQSGNHISGPESYSRMCAFCLHGGGNVTNDKLLYTVILWENVDTKGLGNVALPSFAGSSLGVSSITTSSRNNSDVSNQHRLDNRNTVDKSSTSYNNPEKIKRRTTNKKTMDLIETSVAAISSNIIDFKEIIISSAKINNPHISNNTNQNISIGNDLVVSTHQDQNVANNTLIKKKRKKKFYRNIETATRVLEAKDPNLFSDSERDKAKKKIKENFDSSQSQLTLFSNGSN